MELQVIRLQDVLPITGANHIPGLVPPTLEIHGEDFRSVDQVLINDAEAPEVVLASSTKLLAQIPASELREPIKTVSVLSTSFTRTAASRVLFGVSLNPISVTGIQRMMQTFLINLMTTPGTDAWSPARGGGIQRIVGANFPKDSTGGVVAEFAIAVNRTRAQVIAMQSRSATLTEDERLAGAQILESVFNPNSLGLIARVKLTARSGRSAVANMEL